MYTKLAAALVIALALAGLYWKGYSEGKKAVRAEWNAEKLATQQAALKLIEKRDRDQEALNTKARNADVAYQAEKSKRAAADRVVVGLRDQLTAALDRAASEDSATTGRTDDPRNGIIRECSDAVTELGKEAGRLRGKVAALQEYAGSVCVATP